MKTKNKMLASMEIVVVLFSVFLVALPAIATEQTIQKASTNMITTASSEDDYVLGVYGNANEDDTIDMRDLTYEKLIFFGKKTETELADAKYDGKINPLDFIQIKLIIVGKEKEITIVDSVDRSVTVKKPVKRVIPLSGLTHCEKALKIAGACDKIVGVSDSIKSYYYYFPELRDTPLVGTWSNPDYEAIVSLRPDLVIRIKGSASQCGEKLEPFGIPVVGFDFHKDHILIPELEKLGYILDRENQVKIKEYINWRKGYENIIKDAVGGLTEDEKPRVLLIWSWRGSATAIRCFGPGGSGHQPCIDAGGRNIVAKLGLKYPDISSEWVLKEDPDIITIQLYPYQSGDTWGWKNTDVPEKVISELIKTCGWDNLAAVKNNRFYAHSSEIATGTESIVRTAYWAKWFHPELEIDIVPEDVFREYNEQFVKLDHPEDLIFVYQHIHYE